MKGWLESIHGRIGTEEEGTPNSTRLPDRIGETPSQMLCLGTLSMSNAMLSPALLSPHVDISLIH